MTTVTIASNAVIAKLHNPTREVKLVVQEILSYAIDGAEHTIAFKRGSWDGRSSFLDFKLGTFPAGFVHFVAAKLRHKGYKVRLARKPLPEPQGPELPVIDSFGYEGRYDYQPEVIRRLRKHGQIIAQVATGGGKCLGHDTPVLMFDGTVKKVQDVRTGDLLMGPDSTPRTVLSTCVGVGPLYRVTPTRGDAYVVNDAHILSLKRTCRGYRGLKRNGPKYPKGGIVNVNVMDYLAQNKTFRHEHKGWRTGVDFAPVEPLPVDPYLLGVLLGDGSINGTVSVTTADAEIAAMLDEQAALWGLTCNVIPKSGNAASAIYLTAGRTGGKANPLMTALRALGFVSKNNKAVRKFIPHAYKTASRADRLALLAGILDTDGYFDGKGFYLTLKDERLFDDALFLVRSLGFAAYKSKRQKTCRNNGVVGNYFCMTISGALDTIPVRLPRRKATPRLQKKDPLVTGLTVEPIGKGDYYGFELDGDRLFMLGDFTVTHNTRIARMAFASLNLPTLFLTTRGILMYQMKDAFEKDLGVPVSVLGDGQFGHTITDEHGNTRQAVKKMCVGMVQTLIARLEEKTVEGELEKMTDAHVKKELKEVADLRKKLTADAKTNAEIRNAIAALEKRQETERKALVGTMRTEAAQKVHEHMRDRARTIALLERFGLVILEEAHEASGNSYYEILRHCKNAHYRLALTATPFMKENEESNMRLMACSGPIAIKVSEQTLIDRSILAQPHFKFIPLRFKPQKLHRGTGWQSAYRIGIVENEYRNREIIYECRRMAEYGLTGMILVNQTKHGEVLADKLRAEGIRVEFIQGEDDQVGRKRALGRLARGEIDVLIGTTILDVGVDVPAVGYVILAGGGKAEVALRQRIGRGLREKKNGLPNLCFIIDFDDGFNEHLKMHAKQRQVIIKGTPGFERFIYEGGRDFDLEKLGFTRLREVA